jgi:pyocin large subunit-like protein
VQQVSSLERRERDAQREAVARLLPNPERGALLRAAGGEILIYDESDNKYRPVNLRAVVMPDGTTREFETGRFLRRRAAAAWS